MPIKVQCPRCGSDFFGFLREAKIHRLRRRRIYDNRELICANPECLHIGSVEEFTTVLPDKEESNER